MQKLIINIISQSKIDEILSTKATDRRVIFEEAARVLKYKNFRLYDSENDIKVEVICKNNKIISKAYNKRKKSKYSLYYFTCWSWYF